MHLYAWQNRFLQERRILTKDDNNPERNQVFLISNSEEHKEITFKFLAQNKAWEPGDNDDLDVDDKSAEKTDGSVCKRQGSYRQKCRWRYQ